MKTKLIALAVMAGLLPATLVSSAQTKAPVMGLSVISMFNPFFIAMRDGAKNALLKVGGTLLEADSQQDVARQLAAVESFIARKVDVILLNAVDSAGVIPAVQAANRAGIPVVTVDNDASGGQVATLVASDNVKAGELCAQYLVARLKKEKGVEAGNVVMLDALPVTGVLQRIQGFNSVISKYPRIRVIATQNAQGTRTDGLNVMDSILQAHRDIDAVFAINDPSALGALAAIEAAGRQKDMFIVSVDGNKEALQAIKKGGAFAMTAAQSPADIGRIGVESALRVLKGEKLPRFIPVAVETVTVSNVDDALAKASF